MIGEFTIHNFVNLSPLQLPTTNLTTTHPHPHPDSAAFIR